MICSQASYQKEAGRGLDKLGNSTSYCVLSVRRMLANLCDPQTLHFQAALELAELINRAKTRKSYILRPVSFPMKPLDSTSPGTLVPFSTWRRLTLLCQPPDGHFASWVYADVDRLVLTTLGSHLLLCVYHCGRPLRALQGLGTLTPPLNAAGV